MCGRLSSRTGYGEPLTRQALLVRDNIVILHCDLSVPCLLPHFFTVAQLHSLTSRIHEAIPADQSAVRTPKPHLPIHSIMNDTSASSFIDPKRRASPPSQPSAKRQKPDDEDSEWTRKRKLYNSWEFETDRPMTEPPDINLRQLLAWDAKFISDLLDEKKIGPEERCMQYDRHEVWIESNLLARYSNWGKSMRDLAQQNGDEEREEFFTGLTEELRHDHRVVVEENKAMGREQGRRQQRREALGQLGGRPYIKKGTRCYWDYQEKGFYFWEDGEWRREVDGRRREWDMVEETWRHFFKVDWKWVRQEDGPVVKGGVADLVDEKGSASDGYVTANEEASAPLDLE